MDQGNVNYIPYKSARSRAKVTTILMSIYMFMLLISIMSSWVEINVYSDVTTVVPTEEEVIQASLLSGIVGLTGAFFWIVAMVFFLMWVHRIYKNLPLFAMRKLRTTPGWAVGFYFIPIVNLFKPYQGMKDAWNACSTDPRFDGYEWKERKGTSSIKWWWALWLFSNTVANGVGMSAWRAETTSELISSAKLYIFSDILDLVVYLLMIILIRRLSDRQEQKWQAVLNEKQNDPNYGLAMSKGDSISELHFTIKTADQATTPSEQANHSFK